MTMVDNVLWIDGTKLKDPATVNISRNKIWSQNSGRTKSGTFTGDIVCMKWRIDVTWNALTESEVKTILEKLETPFINVRFKNPRKNNFETIKCYGGDETMPVYNYAIEKSVYESLTVSLVQK